jgi:serine/threonine protein kinase
MGTVYLARHPRLPKAVALKVLNRDLAEDAAIRRRFDLEAAIAARLEHRNIVTVLDRGIADGRLWIAMQYVDGADAATAIPTLGMEPEHAVRIVTAAAAALDHAHAAGVVHRDVKPANILLAEDGRVFLSDFGIARAVDGSTRLTQTGALLGTLDYASPEQLSAADVDGRSDQYSLGCTLFHLLTGRTPYSAAHFGAVLSGHLSGPVPLPSSVRPGLARFDPVLVRAMAKRVDERFATCGELADALTEALTGTGPVTGNRVRSRTPRPDAERGSDALIRMELTLEECAADASPKPSEYRPGPGTAYGFAWRARARSAHEVALKETCTWRSSSYRLRPISGLGTTTCAARSRCRAPRHGRARR